MGSDEFRFCFAFPKPKTSWLFSNSHSSSPALEWHLYVRYITMARELSMVLEEIQLQTVGKHAESQRDGEESPRLDGVCRQAQAKATGVVIGQAKKPQSEK